MRLVYLYARDRQIDVEHYKGEGVHLLFTHLDRENVFDEVVVFFESTSGINFEVEFTSTYKLISSSSPPTLDLIRDRDVLWVRGGFKPWLDFIGPLYEKQNNWILFYGANTGNERWPYWHIVFDDLNMDPAVYDYWWKKWGPGHNRISVHYTKPIAVELFDVGWGHHELIVPEYDVMIGASNIHDKKGQYLTVRALEAMKHLSGLEVSAVMPGAPRRSTHTLRMIQDMQTGVINLSKLHCPGTVSRQHLASLMKKTKVFVHLGTGGQGDRGPLEAMACGCWVILGPSTRHCRMFARDDNTFVTIVKEPNNVHQVMYAITDAIARMNEHPELRAMVSAYFHREYSFYDSVELFRTLKSFFLLYPIPKGKRIGDLFNGIFEDGTS